MQAHDLDEFSTVMQSTAEIYPQKSLSPGALSLYWQALSDLSLSEIRSGLSAHINNPDTGQFMPKPADIRKALGGTTADAALMAWAKVIGAARTIGAYQTVCFDDPVIHAVLRDMGGWQALCHSDVDDQPFREKEFCAKFRAYRGRPAGELSYPPKLLGIFDSTNLPQGFDEQPVALIGDESRAQAVLAGGGRGQWLQVTYRSGEGVQALPMPRLGLLPGRKPERRADAGEVEAAEREIDGRAV